MRSGLTLSAVPVAVLILPALALPLAACKRQAEISATNATPSQVQQKVAAASANGGLQIEPGRWEGMTAIHDMQMPDMPNLPPAARAQLKARMGAAHSFVNCVTAEDVKKAFFTGRSDDKDCKFDHFTLSGGKIDAAMACDRGRQGKVSMTMTGNYGPDSYHMDMSTKAGGMPVGPMDMKMSIDAKRVGACRGTPDES